MNFTVEWADLAITHLAASWVLAPNPQAVNDAQDTIDRLLASDPHKSGRHLSEGMYSIDVTPLRALYVVDEKERVVTIEAVHMHP